MTPNSTSQPAEADRLPPRGSSANQDDTTGFASHDRSNNRGKLDGLSPAEKRDHPWDSSFPARLGKVDIKNTSMEGADGIETTVTTKAGQLGKSLSADSAGISPVHRMRMDRIGQEMHQIKEDSPGFSDSNAIAAMTENADDENGRLSPWHHENTKAMADDFDAAWVSLPSSAFFKSRKMHASESSNRNSSFPYGLHDADDEAVDNTAARPPRDGIQRSSSLAQQGTRRDGPSISTDRSRNLESSTFDGYSRTQENSSLDTKGVNKIDLADGSSQNISGKGRGLRGFLRGKGSLSRGSNDNNSASLSGKQSLETANASYNEAMRDFGAHEAVATTIEKPTEDADRGRRSASKSRSPIRGRAKSLDDRRIRNPSIARKFSRLLRVYDTDKNAAK